MRCLLVLAVAVFAPLAAAVPTDKRPIPAAIQDTRAPLRAMLAEAGAAYEAGDAARCETALRRALALVAMLPANDGDRIAVQAGLAEVLAAREGDEAVQLWRAALAGCAADAPEALAVRDGLARALALRGRWSEAGAVLAEALARRDAARDADGAAFTAALLADVRRAEERPDLAEPLYARALAAWEPQGASRTAERATALHGRGLARLAQGRAEAAAADLAAAVALLDAGTDRDTLALPLADLAVARAEAGLDAGPAFARVIALVEESAGADAVGLVPLLQARARWHAAHARWDAALADGERQAVLAQRAEAPVRAQALDGLVGLCVAAGRRERALAVSADLLALLERELPADAPDLAVARRNHAELTAP